jgi:hypothetical protein
MRIHSRLTTAIAVVALASLGGCAKSLPGGGGSLPSGTVPGGLAGASGEAKPVVYQTEHAEIADRIKVEVLDGVTRADKIKIPDNAGPVKPMMCSSSAAGSKPPAKK